MPERILLTPDFPRARRSLDPVIRTVRLVSPVPVPLGALMAEFPTVSFVQRRTVDICRNVVAAEDWSEASSFAPFDRSLRPTGTLTVVGTEAVDRAALEVLTRYQRFVGRTNAASADARFGVLRALHRALHDVRKPQPRADLEHAIDTWQWVLRLDASARLSVQAAALVHQVDRLRIDSARIQHRAPHRVHPEEMRGRRPAEQARALVANAGYSADLADRVRALVAGQEQRSDDPDACLLDEAAGLSFLSLNSAVYLDDYGPEPSRVKLRATLDRLGARARRRLGSVRLRPDVAALVPHPLADASRS